MSQQVVQPQSYRIPVPNDKFHQLVRGVCAGVTIDECYGQIEDWDVCEVRKGRMHLSIRRESIVIFPDGIQTM